MPLRCLLVDDEPPALDVLELYIENIDGLTVAARCENALDAFRVLQQQPIDLMFLDINMPKLLGTDFLRSLLNPPVVIITTAYSEYALDGFDLNVADYLLKPIPFERFLRAVSKVLKTGEEAPEPPPIGNEPVHPDPTGSLLFRADRKLVNVQTDEILYVESLKDYIRVVTRTTKPLIVKQTISTLESRLPANQFVRIHRSFIVAVSAITSHTTRHVEISGREIPIGRHYQKDTERILSGLIR